MVGYLCNFIAKDTLQKDVYEKKIVPGTEIMIDKFRQDHLSRLSTDKETFVH